MTLSKKTVRLIVILAAVALSGLVVIQTALLKSAMDLKEQAFRQSVMSAMSQISQRLLTVQTLALALGPDNNVDMRSVTASVIAIGLNDTVEDSVCIEAHFPTRPTPGLAPRFYRDSGLVRYSVPSSQHVTVQVYDAALGRNVTLVDEFRAPGEYSFEAPLERYHETDFIWQVRSDSLAVVVGIQDSSATLSIDTPAQDSAGMMLVQAVLRDLHSSDAEPIEERIDPDQFDSLIDISLAEVGIDLECVWGVFAGPGDSLRVRGPGDLEDELRSSPFRARLFPTDIFSAPATLALHFPERSIFLWKQLGALLVPTVILMLVIIGCFALTVRAIVSQRAFSRRIMDFINNMTHEFKTPISTVQLASEAISRPDVAGVPDQVLKFNAMIRSENQRMRDQTEKILQMAALEEGDYELKKTEVDVHRVIEEAIESLALRIESKRGMISADLQATHHSVDADPVHLANIVHNLLDNAFKYSPEEPTITIATVDSADGLSIHIADNGVGIAPDHLKAVFDKYFRVPSGNVHNVKGFGLGLSYVQMMVEAHGGHVTLESEYGAGTVAELVFPIRKAQG